MGTPRYPEKGLIPEGEFNSEFSQTARSQKAKGTRRQRRRRRRRRRNEELT